MRQRLVPEVGATGGQDDPVGVDLLGAHHQHHVAELSVLPQQVDHLQGLPRMLVRNVGHACGLGDPLRELVGVPQGAAAGDVHSRGVLACASSPVGERRSGQLNGRVGERRSGQLDAHSPPLCT